MLDLGANWGGAGGVIFPINRSAIREKREAGGKGPKDHS